MELAIVIAVVVVALAFDYTNGFHDAANAIATSVSTRALTPRVALLLAAVMNFIGALAIEGKQFTYQTNERLHKALEMKLFEDQKDSIKLTSLVSSVVVVMTHLP